MGESLNVTFITLAGFVDLHRYRYLYFTIVLLTYLLIICSNSTIVYLIVTQQSLHEPMYVFIAALLLNSVLYSTVVYPKLLIDFLSDKQLISYSACLFQCFTFYSLGGSEFFLLAAMAFDRYVSICKPLQYPIIMRKTTVSVFLVLAWIVPACHLVILAMMTINNKLCNFTLRTIFCNNSVSKLQCESSRAISVYGVLILLNIALFPMLLILFTYVKILKVSFQSCGKVKRKAAETCLPHLLVLMNFSLFSTYNVLIVRVESDVPKLVNLVMTLQTVLYQPLFNPIIYGLKMSEIHRHLKRLFCQKKN